MIVVAGNKINRYNKNTSFILCKYDRRDFHGRYGNETKCKGRKV